MVLCKNLPVERTVKQQTRVSSKIDVQEFHLCRGRHLKFEHVLV